LDSTEKATIAVEIERALKLVIDFVGYYPGQFGIGNVKIDRHPIISLVSDEATVLAPFKDAPTSTL
jgi:hypothetical protein